MAPSSRLPVPVPDLVSHEPLVRIDVEELRQTLIFAFATGSSPDAFERVMGAVRLPPSAWDPSHFARDLFLAQLVERSFPVRACGRTYEPSSGYLLRVISAPPRARADTLHRCSVLAELAASTSMRAELEQRYVEVTRLRSLLCSGRGLSPAIRRLEILKALQATFGALAVSFAGASSGLARVRAFGAAVVETEAYRRLDALLDHESHLGTVDVRVRVGSDGELRTFQIVAVQENRENPFYASPLGRWIERLRLFLRGYRMNGGEIAERFYDDVFSGLEESIALLFQLLGDMELYLASLGFRDLAEAAGLSVSFPDLAPDKETEARLTLEGLWNPLLLGEKRSPVPCDLATLEAGSVVVVTGPNSGGKTRLLQSIAFCQLLGEGGLFVPARVARLPRVAALFVSFLDEARADQPEGQLGMELMRIRRMFEQLEMGALVLLDELCSGTNPSEGEEIARLVISLLPELRAQVFVTTHLLDFASRLDASRPIPRLEFRQVELDADEQPTYGFGPGVARTSLAHKTAARLGVTRDDLLGLVAAKKRAAAVSSTAAPRPAAPAIGPAARPGEAPALPPGELD
jgi:DNA mismatch repair protein MutS2